MGWIRVTAGLVLALVAGCAGDDDEPRWLALADGYAPAADGGERWLETAIPDTTWRAGPWPGFYEAPRPLPASVMNAEATRAKLHLAGSLLEQVPVPRTPADVEAVPPGGFAVTATKVWLRPPTGLGILANARLEVAVDPGRAVDGTWRAVVGGVTGAGLPLAPGAPLALDVDVRAGEALRGLLVVRALGPGETPIEASLVVDVDGSEVASVRTNSASTWVEAPLVAGSRLTLSLAVDTADVELEAALFAPTLAPSDAETPARDDVVLFLADTFRADNLTTFGGSEEWSARLDAFAARCVRFQRAWAPATWTLPSQASLLSGLFPLQHGATEEDRVLADEAVTVAETLAAAGYRTVAVTDSAFVSRRFGLDQGFELFVEHADWSLERTLRQAREVLESGDGRPTFLFVQTYRTHTPYRVGPHEDDGDWNRLASELAAEVAARADDPAALDAAAAELARLYRRGATALDAEVGAFLDALEADGALARTAFVFTSDHGEAFREHGELGHGGTGWEEKLRVPLLLFAPGVEARDEPRAASLVDLPRTLCDLAGVEPDPSWLGRSLVTLDRDRPVFAFGASGGEAYSVVIEGEAKVFADADGVRAAFHLGDDPGETTNRGDEDWAGALLERLGPALESVSAPRVEAGQTVLSPEQLEALRKIGYGGD